MHSNDIFSSNKLWVGLTVGSFALHLGGVFCLGLIKGEGRKVYQPIAVTVNKTVKEVPKPVEEPKPEEKPKPKPKPKKIEKLQPVAQQAPPPKVQGLSKDSFAKDGSGSGFVAPEGNSLAVEDKGIRDEVKPVSKAGAARIDMSSFEKPELTTEARLAEIDLEVSVDIYINAKGEVEEIKFAQRVGYGMDDLIRRAIRRSKYQAATDEAGVAIPSWVNLEFVLKMTDS